MLKAVDTAATVVKLCGKYGISDTTYFNLKAKFGGMIVSDAGSLKALKTEKVKLKADCWYRTSAEGDWDGTEQKMDDRFCVRWICRQMVKKFCEDDFSPQWLLA